jgi:hypothetical protein
MECITESDVVILPVETVDVYTSPSVPKKASDPSLRSNTTPILIEIAKPIPDPKTEGSSDYCRDRGKTNYCVWNQRINKRIARFLL